MSLDFRKEQQRYYHFAKHLFPVGFAHYMRPKSIEELFRAIGLTRIKRSKVLEVGCGQGYLVNHFLYAGAQHVIGTEIDPQILMTIPKQAYALYEPGTSRRKYKQTVEFKLQPFEQTDPHIQVDIITIFIGNKAIVEKAIHMFRDNTYIKVLAFMVPTRNFNKEELIMWCDMYRWNKTEFSIALSGSGEQRRTIVLKKSTHIEDLT
jgi:SAM-dependent methyltransferase